jgi:hypothetical protein
MCAAPLCPQAGENDVRCQPRDSFPQLRACGGSRPCARGRIGALNSGARVDGRTDSATGVFALGSVTVWGLDASIPCFGNERIRSGRSLAVCLLRGCHFFSCGLHPCSARRAECFPHCRKVPRTAHVNRGFCSSLWGSGCSVRVCSWDLGCFSLSNSTQSPPGALYRFLMCRVVCISEWKIIGVATNYFAMRTIRILWPMRPSFATRSWVRRKPRSLVNCALFRSYIVRGSSLSSQLWFVVFISCAPHRVTMFWLVV